MSASRVLKTTLQGKALSHPLHPALVHLPIGCWTLSFLFDLLGFFSEGAAWQNAMLRASIVALLLGVLFAVPAVMTGLAEFVDIPVRTKTRRIAWAHMLLNLALAAGYLLQVILRSPRVLSREALIVNGASMLLLMFSGYLGGRLVYEHRVGMRSAENPQRLTHPEDHRVLAG